MVLFNQKKLSNEILKRSCVRTMKNVEHFGDLTPRMSAFREQVLDKKPYISAERALLATESYKQNLNQPSVMKRALMLKNILEKMTIYIEDENDDCREPGGIE